MSRSQKFLIFKSNPFWKFVALVVVVFVVESGGAIFGGEEFERGKFDDDDDDDDDGFLIFVTCFSDNDNDGGIINSALPLVVFSFMKGNRWKCSNTN